jgi:N,N'-diacetyllegionaminate synthase
MKQFEIAGRPVGDEHPPYVIAEIGSNHNGDMGLCFELIDAAAECGVDAVKFQSWSSTSLVGEAEYERNTTYSDKKKHFGSLREMVEAYQFTPEMHEQALARCAEKGVAFLSTAFSPEEVDLLERLGVGCHKVASMDVNHPVLLRAIGATGKPVVLSTGMATLGEVETAVQVLKEAGAGEVCLLHCVSIYPPDPRDVHLRNIPMLRQAFDANVGFSDHTIGVAVPLAAVALGACMIEKHFTIDKDMEGWDHAISADPAEMKRLVQESRMVHATLGSSVRTVSEAEMEKRKRFRRRIVARRELPAGHVLTLEDLDFKRPGTGIHPNEYEYVVGKRLTRAVKRDHELEWSDLA